MSESAHFSAAITELPEMLLWVRNHLIHAKIESEPRRKMELAAEEAIVNVIHHAYRRRGGPIELIFKHSPTKIELSIVDQGRSFDPCHGPQPDLTSPLEERQEGNLGLFLMRACVDDLHYKRKNGTNILTLVKKLTSS